MNSISLSNDTDKLGPVKPQPAGSKFTLPLRMPGWHADTQGAKKLFPEEALLGKVGFHAFPVPKHPVVKGKAFAEPGAGASDTAWIAFNQWILGEAIPANPISKFDTLLAEIAKRVRRYNAAMYWARRLHFHENATPVAIVPAANPDGPKDERDLGASPLDKTDPRFSGWVSNAEGEWSGAVDGLNAILADDPAGYGFVGVMADMIEVNGYIVSMRIVASDAKGAETLSDDERRILEFGGSSSSHVSVSSAFSTL